MDQDLWGLFRSANARKDWTGIWDDVEHASIPIENIEHYLWDAQPEFPSSERSLLFSDLYGFLKRREVEHYPRTAQLRTIWHERVMTAQNHYKQLSKQTNEIAPSVWSKGAFMCLGSFKDFFDIREMNLSFVFERESDHGALTDVWYGNGVTPDGVEFFFQQIDFDWLANSFLNDDPELREVWMRVELAIDLENKPFSTSVDSVLCAMGLTHHDFEWHEKSTPDEPDWLTQFIPHKVMRQDDNGHEFEVGVYGSRSEAMQELKAIEHNIHKQHYWVERAES